MKYVIHAIPPSLNRFAGRKNMWAYREAKQVWKNIAIRSLHPKPEKPIEKCRMQITFFFPDKRKRDYDNYLKMLLDGIAAAGIIADDNFNVIQTLKICGEVDKNEPRIEIEITEERK